MLLNILDVISNEGFVLPVDEKIEPFEFTFAGENYSFAEPVDVKGKAQNMGNTIEIDVDISAKIAARCVRCLADVTFGVDVHVTEALEPADYENNSGMFDLRNFAEQMIVGEIPARILCKEDCAGLCPVCGGNLNKVKCECKEDNHDPRFDILKKIKFE